MSKKNSNIIFISIVVVLVLIAIGFLVKSSTKSTRFAQIPTYNSQPTSMQMQSPTLTPSQSITNSNTSDTQLNKDAQDIETNLNNLDNQVNAYNAGLNNQSADNPQSQ